MKIRDGDPDWNLRSLDEVLASAPPSDFVLVPELWSSGYEHSSWPETAKRVTPKRVDWLRERSSEMGAHIAGSMISLNDEGRLVNRMWIVPPDGDVETTYDKVHLFPLFGEPDYLAAGKKRCQFEILDWVLSATICFDLRFPEEYSWIRSSDLLIVSSEWPRPRCDAFRTLALARAIENQAFIAVSNRVGAGAAGSAVYCGNSFIAGPDGTMIAQLGDEQEGAVGATLDLEQVRVHRKKLPTGWHSGAQR